MALSSNSASSAPVWDVIIIGGGPAGAVAGMTLAKMGHKAIILEKAVHPRFHLGESFLPAAFVLLKEMGLEEAFRKLPHVPKFGVEFSMGNGGKLLDIDFADGFVPGAETFNVERALFDEMLLNETAKRGVEVHQNCGVQEILKLTDGHVVVRTSQGQEIQGRYLLDASGQGAVVGKHLGTYKPVEEPYLKKVAYFGHFENVFRYEDRRAGHPFIVMTEEGWFWIIPLNDTVTSVGVVMDAHHGRELCRTLNLPPNKLLAWCIDNTPVVQKRMVNSSYHEKNQIMSDFSYRCRPYAGEGYFLIGDAAAFMDPIFSTGVSVAVNAAKDACSLIDKLLARRITPQKARAAYIANLERSTGTIFTTIRRYYDHSFRELLLHEKGPLQVHRAVIGVLAGNVFPRPAWKVRWRMKMFEYCVEINRRRQIVPRRKRFSLIKIAQQQMAEAGTSAVPADSAKAG